MEIEIQSSPADIGTAASAQPDPLLASSAATPTTVAGQQVSAQTQASQPVLDTTKLKALLITLGHDVEAEWDHLIALAKKAL